MLLILYLLLSIASHTFCLGLYCLLGQVNVGLHACVDKFIIPFSVVTLEMNIIYPLRIFLCEELLISVVVQELSYA